MKTCATCGEEKPLAGRRRVCDDCKRAAAYERHRNYRHGASREKFLASKKRTRERYRDKIREDWARYYEANADRLSAYKREALASGKHKRSYNPEASSRSWHRYRARKLEAFVADVEFDTIVQRDQGICGICMQPVMEPTAELDHIIPLATGGTHEPDNVQLAHRSCNRRKGTRADFTLVQAA